MLTMQRFFAPLSIGIEITAAVVRLGVVGWNNGKPAIHASRTIDLPDGVVTEVFALQAISDAEQLAGFLRSGLREFSPFGTNRIGLSLPDAMFRIQTLEFEELPSAAPDREKLIRWRLEKGSAFDMSGTALRFQARERPEGGHLVLAAVAKREMLASLEDALSGSGFEVWTISPSSFTVLNFYAPHLAGRGTYALARLSGGSYSTLIVDNGMPRFYRYREIKASAREEIVGRLVRELDDSLHFYTHRDREQRSEVGHLYVAGEQSVTEGLAEAFKSGTTLEIELLSAGTVLPFLEREQVMMDAVIGATEGM